MRLINNTQASKSSNSSSVNQRRIQTPVIPSSNNMEGFENERRNREVDEATLVELVRNRGFTIVPMEGDGNCMFRAIGMFFILFTISTFLFSFLAHQMYGDQDMHDQIRLLTMNYMVFFRYRIFSII